eukprot:TRINITY_DN6184_c0_g1_i11.p2 TRINITY_DN6184_c0_g1~~TRINITY_DN6184_c0_g1_i11.p2  ORF type:complete len:115 (-),score=26.97 TRINITY_DN6184_c0_g1_i11:657-1001(-)
MCIRDRYMGEMERIIPEHSAALEKFKQVSRSEVVDENDLREAISDLGRDLEHHLIEKENISRQKGLLEAKLAECQTSIKQLQTDNTNLNRERDYYREICIKSPKKILQSSSQLQ